MALSCWAGGGDERRDVRGSSQAARNLYPDLTLKATSARMWTARGLLPNPEKVERLGGRLGTGSLFR